MSAEAGTGEAVIVGAEITAGHDGAAELLVRLRYENGVVGPVVLDPATGLDLMRACGADSLAGLVGRPWREIVKGL
ncbi:MAG TPA: hypothetical protein VG939_02310 [Caulobacteraceae bacterium]|nr:hypothetical protein [Caulobacteraceae bacterium]